jgi:hypothetical protein
MKKQKTASIKQRIQNIHVGLDLGFSDFYRGENVRDRTIRKHLKEIEETVAVLHAEEAINFSLFQTLGEDHPSANIYILDFPSDLRAAFYLLLGGYYRPALLSLRNWLEMRLLGVCFGRIELDRENYRKWKLGNLEAPFGRGLVHRLFARAEFRKVDAQFQVRKRLEGLYSDLSAFTHGAGLEKYALQKDTDNVPRYNRASVRLWLKMFDRTFAEVAFWLFLAYSNDAFRALSLDEIKTVLAHLPSAYRRTLEVGLVAKLKT